jgi:hypothetical protein
VERKAIGSRRPIEASDDHECPITIHVIATTNEGTRCALVEARRLTADLFARIVILVPHQVSYAIPLTNPTEVPEVIADQYAALASALGVDATVRLCLCRRADDVFRLLLMKESLVVIGGRRTWWPSRVERLARRLTKSGHTVVVASVDVDPTRTARRR